MILSDRDIRAAIEAGEIGIEPFDAADIQPSSVDLHVDRFFRTFHNARHPFIDVKKPMEDLTEMFEVEGEEPFILHPGEFVLGSTSEYVKLPDHLVARLEGKSSLGRLGLLIHSSLPGDEEILFFDGMTLEQRPIEEIVRKRLEGDVVSFDPETFQVGYHHVTGWHESAPDRIFEVRLASGRSVRLTGGHDLFSLDRDGEMVKLRVHELAPGTLVAIPGAIPDPPITDHRLQLLTLVPEAEYGRLICGGPAVEAAFRNSLPDITTLLADIRIAHHRYYRRRRCLPLSAALQLPGFSLGPEDWLAVRGGRHRMPAVLDLNEDLAWLLGLYVAEGSRRARQITISNTNQGVLDRAQATLATLGLPVYRAPNAITCCSDLLSKIITWLGSGGHAREKRIPRQTLGWSTPLLEAFLEGFIAGDGSIEQTRTCLWSSSQRLIEDLLLVSIRLGKRAAACRRRTRHAWQITLPHREHKLLTRLPLPDRLLLAARIQSGFDQKTGARAAGFKHNTQLNNIERGGASAVQMRTIRRLRDAYSAAEPTTTQRLDRLVDGDVRWDSVVEVRDSRRVEPVFDLEVRPSGRRIENFVAGRGGVFVSNTAGYVDPGFEGHLTLELSNVANLPITIYPNMKIGQISFFQLTSPADAPYGSGALGSKYQGQRGPTPSRFHENFKH